MRRAAEGLHTIGIAGIEQPRSREVQHGVKVGLAIGLRGKRESPASIAGLDGLIEVPDLGCAI